MHTFPLVSIPIFDILIFVLLFYPQLYFRVSYYRVINQKQSFSFLFCFTREKEVGTMPRSNDSETFLVFSFRQKYTTQNWKCCNSFPFILYWAESERGFYQRKNIKIAWKSWKRRKTVAVWQKKRKNREWWRRKAHRSSRRVKKPIENSSAKHIIIKHVKKTTDKFEKEVRKHNKWCFINTPEHFSQFWP